MTAGFQRERRTVGHRVWHQVCGDLGQSVHQCRGGFLHTSQRHQDKDGEESG